jgi:DNA repair protein RecO (recombination protein O)
MSQTYKAVGITLKSVPMGENDRLLTILTPEFGLKRLIAPDARKYRSKLGGRSGVFLLNELLITKGRSMDKINQAETLESYQGLSKNLGKLASAQYLAEIALHQGINEHPQEHLFALLTEHLRRLETLPNHQLTQIIAYLTHGIFHLLALDGIAPQVHHCCLTQESLIPDLINPNWNAGFSITGGGIFNLSELQRLEAILPGGFLQNPPKLIKNSPNRYHHTHKNISPNYTKINGQQLAILQLLSQPNLPIDQDNTIEDQENNLTHVSDWVFIERLLRQYAQYHLDFTIRSAPLIDSLTV